MRDSTKLVTRSWAATSMRSVTVGSPHLTGLRVPVIQVSSRVNQFGEWTFQTLTFQSSIASAWTVILAAEPDHAIIHPVIPAEWPRKAARAFRSFRSFCAEVCHWQDDRGYFGTIMHPSDSGFGLSQCSRSLKWRNSMTLATFKQKGEQLHGELSFLTNLPEGSLDRLESLADGYNSMTLFDPRLTVLLSQCLVDNRYSSDLRQAYLLEALFGKKF